MAAHISLFCKLCQEELFHFHKGSVNISARLFDEQTGDFEWCQPANYIHLLRHQPFLRQQ